MVLASSSQATIVAPILPRIGEALQIPEALQGTLVTGHAIALSIFAVIIDPISDRFGRRTILSHYFCVSPETVQCHVNIL